MKVQSAISIACLSMGLITAVLTTSAQTTLILTPSQDTEIGYHDNYNSANTNYNAATHFSGFAQPGNAGGVNSGRGLIQFDLSGIPTDATVIAAFLNLSASGPTATTGAVTSIGSIGQNSCKLLRVTSAWNDNTVTWNTQPTTTTSDAVSVEQSTYAMQNYLNINVTDLAQLMVADPASNFGLMLQLDNETPTRGLCFYSGLAPEPDKAPSLLVVYGDCGTSGIVVVDGGNGTIRISPSITSSGATVQLEMDRAPFGKTDLMLINNIGQVVYTRMAERYPVSITVPPLAQGAYTWKVQNAVGQTLGAARMVVQ